MVEHAFWDADKLDPQMLLKGAVEGIETDLLRSGGNVSYQPQRVVISLGDLTHVINLSSIRTIMDSNRAFADIYSFLLQHERTSGEATQWEHRAISGMIKTLDLNSEFMPPHVFRELREETKGSVGAAGLQVGFEKEQMVILEVIAESPALRSGLKRGDRLVAIDGHSVQGLTLREAVRKLRGPRGTRLIITIMRDDFDDPKDFTVTRDVVNLRNVVYKKLDDNIGYVRLRSFDKSTGAELEKALHDLDEQKITGLILDLRNNLGGLLNQAVQVADKFIEKGQLIAATKGRARNQNMRFVASSDSKYRQYPLIVLINSSSAAGAEIVGGALQDLQRATIIGTKSYGRGSIQTIIPLQDGSALRLTTAYFLTPNGRHIEGIGIIPDTEIQNTGDADRQLSIAHSLMKAKLTE